MRPLALTASLCAALAGTGCYVDATPATGDAHVYWRFAHHAPAQAGGFLAPYDDGYANPPAASTSGTCAQSYVDTVRVMWAGGAFDISCTGPSGGSWVQGAIVPFLPAGQNWIRLIGYRGPTAVYDTTNYNVMVPSNGVVPVQMTVLGVPARLEVFADPYDGATMIADCAAASNPNFRVEIFDPVFGDKVDGYDSSCSDPLPAYVYGQDLDVDDQYTVRVRGFDPVAPHGQILDSCDLRLDHLAAQVGDGPGGTGYVAGVNTVTSCSTP